VAAYILGSIPFGLLLGRLFAAADVREVGSGNIGATNVARAAGPVAGILTLLFDAGKGALAVLLAARLANQSALWMMIAGICALLGHCFPIWLGFRGGKGVATAAGVFLVLCPFAFLGAAILFVLVVVYWRFVSLASISAAAAMPLLIYFFWAPHHAPPHIVTFGSLAAACLIAYKHDGNIQRLVQGTEPKFTFGKKKDEA
jgi:acyl phosphate:glycerol-3-phosphate acyltransferase